MILVFSNMRAPKSWSPFIMLLRTLWGSEAGNKTQALQGQCSMQSQGRNSFIGTFGTAETGFLCGQKAGVSFRRLYHVIDTLQVPSNMYCTGLSMDSCVEPVCRCDNDSCRGDAWIAIKRRSVKAGMLGALSKRILQGRHSLIQAWASTKVKQLYCFYDSSQ